MNNPTEPTLKIRFRLPKGEEFEAEGPREFIESQRNYFLQLIGNTQNTSLQSGSGSDSGINPGNNAPQHTEQYLWEMIFKQDADTLIMRNKHKLPTTDITLLLIAAARILLQKEEYSALELAKSLKANHIEGMRLDRLLAPAMQAGYLSAQGSKRSRTYKLSDSGFAKAYMLAEKIRQN